MEDSVVITELTRSVIEHRLTVKQIREVRRKIREGSITRTVIAGGRRESRGRVVTWHGLD